MDKAEFVVWAAALQTYFPRYNILPNEAAMELWYQELQDIPADLLTTGLRKWVVTEKWPPTIAELRDVCAEIVQGKAPDWGDAWREVVKAIGRYGIFRPEEAIASMSPLTQEAVRRISWTEICNSSNTDTLRAQFRQVYEIVSKRQVEDRKLPAALKEAIAAVSLPRMEGRHAPALQEAREGLPGAAGGLSGPLR